MKLLINHGIIKHVTMFKNITKNGFTYSED